MAQLKSTFLTVGRDGSDPSMGIVHEFSRDEYGFVERKRGAEFAVTDAAVVVMYKEKEEEGNGLKLPPENTTACP